MNRLDLTTSDLEAAFERVAENEGCAGVDGITIDDYRRREAKEHAALLTKLRDRTYRPLPLRKIVIEKSPGSGKMRRLLVPAVRDRVLQTAAARALSLSFEEEFLEASFAYRPGRGVDRAVARILQLRDLSFEHIVDADIRQFFDQVDHSLLLDLLRRQEASEEAIELLTLWIRADYWDGARVRPLRRGVAQGSPISPLLANFFLTGFDRALSRKGNHLVRYADDFVILCPTQEAAGAAMEDTRAHLAQLNLALHPEKTRLTHFHEGFTYLGVYFFGNRAWIPWKHAAKAEGRMLFCAQPMPAHLLARYESSRGSTEMELAFAEAKRGRPQPIPAPPHATQPAPGGPLVAYLYITEQGSVLRKSGDRFLVEAAGRVVLDLPYHKLEAVLLFGRVQVTTQAMGELLERGIPLSLFHRQGRYRGSLWPARGAAVSARQSQFALYGDAERSLLMARATVQAKLGNALAVVDRYAGRVETSRAFGERRTVLAHAREAAGTAGSLETLLGVEGTGARAYFDAVMEFNRSPFRWEGRAKRPSPDPLNALLSLTYMLLMNELAGVLHGLGLDAYVGFLHRLEDRRMSLALDLLEPFRHPVADRLVLTLANRGTFAREDFVESPNANGGVVLTQDGLRRFLGLYERWMLGEGERPGYRRALRQECERFLAVARDGAEWRPFAWADWEEDRGEGDGENRAATV